MVKYLSRRLVSIILIVCLLTGALTGCGKNNSSSGNDADINNEIPEATESPEMIPDETDTHSTNEELESDTDLSESNDSGIDNELITEEEAKKQEEEEAKKQAEEAKKQAEEEAKKQAEEEAKKQAEEEAKKQAEEEAQKQAEEEKTRMNSYAMLSYLTITSAKIGKSKNNRLELDEIYSELLNDLNPSVVDEETQKQLRNLREIIKSFISNSIKKERVQFVYNQSKAAAIRSAVPNPILALTKSDNWIQLAKNIAYTVADSVTKYKNANSSADMEYIMSGWELEDEELKAIYTNREHAFDYMVNMVRAYKLDGILTLNEEAVQQYVEICNTVNIPEKIKKLVAQESVYGLLGNYWLELADCYFEMGLYSDCLVCINKYKELSIDIYRRDYEYGKILPKVIVAAQNTYNDYRYVTRISTLADELTDIMSSNDWATGYFVAQVYMDLYNRSSNIKYLRKAYDIIDNNVVYLLSEQRYLNDLYLNDIQEIVVNEPDYRYMTDTEAEKKKAEYKEEVKKAKEYNKSLKEKREKELPSLSEPFILNCEFLFSLASKLGLSKDEMRVSLDAMKGIFLTEPLNVLYGISAGNNDYNIEIETDEVRIPANLLTEKAHIYFEITSGDSKYYCNDCVIDEVVREGADISTFYAVIESDRLDDYEWSLNTEIIVHIVYEDAYKKDFTAKYYVGEYEEAFLPIFDDKVVFYKK